jgi:hypothetical protein
MTMICFWLNFVFWLLRKLFTVVRLAGFAWHFESVTWLETETGKQRQLIDFHIEIKLDRCNKSFSCDGTALIIFRLKGEIPLRSKLTGLTRCHTRQVDRFGCTNRLLVDDWLLPQPCHLWNFKSAASQLTIGDFLILASEGKL